MRQSDWEGVTAVAWIVCGALIVCTIVIAYALNPAAFNDRPAATAKE